MMTGTNQRLRETLCCFTETVWRGSDTMNDSFSEWEYAYVKHLLLADLNEVNARRVHTACSQLAATASQIPILYWLQACVWLSSY